MNRHHDTDPKTEFVFAFLITLFFLWPILCANL